MRAMSIRVTHIGTATVLLEVGGLRILTDPALDPPGKEYGFGFGTRSTKLAAPALPPGGLGAIDLVLLSHDQHADNLDDAGRAILPSARRVITTQSGARRLRGNAEGLPVWERTEATAPAGGTLRITATPARHGPPLSRPVAGEVIGFVLEWDGFESGPLYISGDTVWFDGVAEVARRFRAGTALLHIGGVRFPVSGPLRYTMSGEEAARAATALGAKTVVPIHYSGWTHFREDVETTRAALVRAGLTERVRWLVPGEPTELPA
jgi:L-ascorbate metabolism protein UlaG (beta-lactamase superfamily)